MNQRRQNDLPHAGGKIWEVGDQNNRFLSQLTTVVNTKHAKDGAHRQRLGVGVEQISGLIRQNAGHLPWATRAFSTSDSLKTSDAAMRWKMK